MAVLYPVGCVRCTYAKQSKGYSIRTLDSAGLDKRVPVCDASATRKHTCCTCRQSAGSECEHGSLSGRLGGTGTGVPVCDNEQAISQSRTSAF
jgi:hypothetical protein